MVTGGNMLKVKVYECRDGAEVLFGECPLPECVPDYEAGEYAQLEATILKNGLAYVGGGAAPLFMLVQA
jgi:hypothetical protein